MTAQLTDIKLWHSEWSYKSLYTIHW